MSFYFFALQNDEQQLKAIRACQLPYSKYIIGEKKTDFSNAKEDDIIAIFGHGEEATRGNKKGSDVRAIHNYCMWGENNLLNLMGDPTPFNGLPKIMTDLGLKPAKYKFVFVVCFSGQETIDWSDPTDWTTWDSDKEAWKPNIEVFAESLRDQGKGFAGSSIFGPTGPITRTLDFWGSYQTICYWDWLVNKRSVVACNLKKKLTDVKLNASASKGVMTEKTCPDLTVLEQLFL